MERRPQVVKLDGVHHKWFMLMTHAQNGTMPVHRCTFPSVDEAKHAYYRMRESRERNPWFRLELIRKDCDVYIVKSDAIQEVIVKG